MKAKKILTIHIYENKEELGVRVHREANVSDAQRDNTVLNFWLSMFRKTKGIWDEKKNYMVFKISDIEASKK